MCECVSVCVFRPRQMSWNIAHFKKTLAVLPFCYRIQIPKESSKKTRVESGLTCFRSTNFTKASWRNTSALIDTHTAKQCRFLIQLNSLWLCSLDDAVYTYTHTTQNGRLCSDFLKVHIGQNKLPIVDIWSIEVPETESCSFKVEHIKLGIDHCRTVAKVRWNWMCVLCLVSADS